MGELVLNPPLPSRRHRLSSKPETGNPEGCYTLVLRREGDRYKRNPKWEKMSGWAGVAVSLNTQKYLTFKNSVHV